MNIIVALANGIWNRLIGMLSGGSLASPRRLAEIALTPPTSTRLTVQEAASLLTMGRDAVRAGAQWFNETPPSAINIPNVPGPSHPNLDGGPDGAFQYA